LKDGIGNGFFDLKKDYIEGQYMVRAYTHGIRTLKMILFLKNISRFFKLRKKQRSIPSATSRL